MPGSHFQRYPGEDLQRPPALDVPCALKAQRPLPGRFCRT